MSDVTVKGKCQSQMNFWVMGLQQKENAVMYHNHAWKGWSMSCVLSQVHFMKVDILFM